MRVVRVWCGVVWCALVLIAALLCFVQGYLVLVSLPGFTWPVPIWIFLSRSPDSGVLCSLRGQGIPREFLSLELFHWNVFLERGVSCVFSVCAVPICVVSWSVLFRSVLSQSAAVCGALWCAVVCCDLLSCGLVLCLPWSVPLCHLLPHIHHISHQYPSALSISDSTEPIQNKLPCPNTHLAYPTTRLHSSASYLISTTLNLPHITSHLHL